MASKVMIHKVSADGEQISQEIQLEKQHYDLIAKGKPLREVLEVHFALADDRQYEINKRIMAAGYYQKKLAKVSPEAAMLVMEIWDVLHGRKSGPAVDSVLEQDRLEREAEIARLQKAADDSGEPIGPDVTL